LLATSEDELSSEDHSNAPPKGKKKGPVDKEVRKEENEDPVGEIEADLSGCDTKILASRNPDTKVVDPPMKDDRPSTEKKEEDIAPPMEETPRSLVIDFQVVSRLSPSCSLNIKGTL